MIIIIIIICIYYNISTKLFQTIYHSKLKLPSDHMESNYDVHRAANTQQTRRSQYPPENKTRTFCRKLLSDIIRTRGNRTLK